MPVPGEELHACTGLNASANPGGCGLYGAEYELRRPGQNACRSMGSCATPINAERFITTGGLRGTGVWARARKLFEDVYQAKHDKEPGPQPKHSKHGPTVEWINRLAVAVITDRMVLSVFGAKLAKETPRL